MQSEANSKARGNSWSGHRNSTPTADDWRRGRKRRNLKQPCGQLERGKRRVKWPAMMRACSAGEVGGSGRSACPLWAARRCRRLASPGGSPINMGRKPPRMFTRCSSRPIIVMFCITSCGTFFSISGALAWQPLIVKLCGDPMPAPLSNNVVRAVYAKSSVKSGLHVQKSTEGTICKGPLAWSRMSLHIDSV